MQGGGTFRHQARQPVGGGEEFQQFLRAAVAGQAELQEKDRGQKRQRAGQDEEVLFAADVDQAHHGHDQQARQGQGNDRQQQEDQGGQGPVREGIGGLDPVDDEGRDDDEHGGQVFVDQDDAELGRDDLKWPGGQGDQEFEVAREIECRKDIKEAEDQDEELAGQDGQGQQRRFLALVTQERERRGREP